MQIQVSHLILFETQTDPVRFKMVRTEDNKDNTSRSTISQEKAVSQSLVSSTRVHPPKKTTSVNTVGKASRKMLQPDNNKKIRKHLKYEEKKWIVTRNGRQYIEVPPELKHLSAEEEMKAIKQASSTCL